MAREPDQDRRRVSRGRKLRNNKHYTPIPYSPWSALVDKVVAAAGIVS